VAVGTYGTNLQSQAEALLAAGVSIVEVYSDAATDAAYAAHKRGDVSAGRNPP
jgi:hypothetical protein